MKTALLTTFLTATAITDTTFANPCDSVIPAPAKVEALEGEYSLKPTSITGPENEVNHLIKGIKDLTKIELQPRKKDQPGKAGSINIVIDEKSSITEEGYILLVAKSGVTITAKTKTGAFYGVQTLLQMVDQKDDGYVIPAARIEDKPRFSWRGMMLDEGRHFQGKTAVKLLLDNMAARKLNRFHWHLTEDEGWRIEVKGYPELTDIGAWRGQGTPMPAVKWRGNAGLGKIEVRYGGYYTQKDLKEIVAYAKERHIEVVPEIDMPGHTNALITSLPHLGVDPDPKLLEEVRKNDKTLRNWELTGDSPTAYRNNIMSATKPATYKFIGDLFDQMAEIFPYKYWHVGGDEVRPLYWQANQDHRDLMAKNGWTDPHQIQNMFLLKVEKMMNQRGKTMVGWNEIMKGGHMSKDTHVMAWISIGAGIKAAKEGYPTIMAVAPHTYFDMGYPGKGERKSNGWAGMIDSKKAYEWNPLFEEKLTPAEQKKVIGVHACVWTEYVPNPEDMSYKFWPRACSTAEVAWSPQQQRSWPEFRQRLGRHLTYFDNNGTYYRVAPPVVHLKKGKVTIEPAFDSLKTLYTLDGSNPAESGKEHKGETFTAAEAKNIKAITRSNSGIDSILIDSPVRAKVGSYRLHQKKNEITVEVDLTSQLDEAGKWTLFADLEKGDTTSSLTKVELIENGKSVVTSQGASLIKKEKAGSISFDVTNFNKGSNYTAKLTFTRKPSAPNERVKGMGAIRFDKTAK